jgi:hypothetical protein
MTEPPERSVMALDAHVIARQVRAHLRPVGSSLISASSLQGTLARWVGGPVVYRAVSTTTAPADVESAAAMFITDARPVSHRLGGLYTGDGEGEWMAAEVRSWVDYLHPGLRGRAEARAMRDGELNLGEAVYKLGGRRRTTNVTPVDRLGPEGQLLVLEVCAVLDLQDVPVAAVRELISARAVAAALGHPDRLRPPRPSG